MASIHPLPATHPPKVDKGRSGLDGPPLLDCVSRGTRPPCGGGVPQLLLGATQGGEVRESWTHAGCVDAVAWTAGACWRSRGRPRRLHTVVGRRAEGPGGRVCSLSVGGGCRGARDWPHDELRQELQPTVTTILYHRCSHLRAPACRSGMYVPACVVLLSGKGVEG